MLVRVDWQPIGRRSEVSPGTLVLDVARATGLDLVAVCGGAGLCEACRVRVVAGQLAPPTHVERSALGEEGLREGWRLACQAAVEADVVLAVPPESLSAPQRLQIEAATADIRPEPVLRSHDLVIDPPALSDLRADARRVDDALGVHLRFPLPVLYDLPARLRRLGWRCRVVARDDEAVAVLPPGTRVFGLAADIGTTKLAAYLVDLERGDTLATSGRMNPQIPFGEDVISRIAWIGDSAARVRELQGTVIAALNEIVDEWSRTAGISRDSIVDAVIVGNTAMHHLVAGLPVSSLGEAPYVPVVTAAYDTRASAVGLRLSPGAGLHLPPNIAGYVGADHVAMLLAARIAEATQPTLAIDIGTNTEMTLAAGGRLLTCSCASGPAFEGAHISQGMRAAPGAVERVMAVGDEIRVHTVGDGPAVGICGSGVLDAVAEMRRLGVLDRHGAIRAGAHPAVAGSGPSPEFVLVPAALSATGRPVTITRRDVNEIQLAKAAIRAGIEVLLMESGVTEGEICRVVVAGAFGSYVNLSSAVAVGLLPPFGRASVEQIGNGAGAGARQMLVSAGQRRAAARLAECVTYVELTTHPAFADAFARGVVL